MNKGYKNSEYISKNFFNFDGHDTLVEILNAENFKNLELDEKNLMNLITHSAHETELADKYFALAKDDKLKERYLDNLSREYTLVDGYIIGQKEDDRQFAYGYADDGRNTCGIIAVYNASVSLGESSPSIADISLYFEIHGKVLNGRFGTYPDHMPAYFEDRGYDVNIVYKPEKPEEFTQAVAENDASIVLRVNKSLTSGVHYMALKPGENEEAIKNITVYNRYSDSKGEEQVSWNEIVENETNLSLAGFPTPYLIAISKPK